MTRKPSLQLPTSVPGGTDDGRARAITTDHAIAAVQQVIAKKGDRVPLVEAGSDLREELGLRSLDLANVLIQLELTIGATLDPSALFNCRFVADLTRLPHRDA